MNPYVRLEKMLRPPGRGVATFATAQGMSLPLLKQIYGSENFETILERWKASLRLIPEARVMLLGIPSDTGASVVRGANFGPKGIREAYWARYGKLPTSVLDIGDVLCIPQLLHDEMLSEAQIQKTRDDVFGGEAFPVSALSLAEAVLGVVLELNPSAAIAVLGGDHSISWPCMVYCQKRFGENFGVLHFDAHTDLMVRRMGVDYCFATWAHHACQGMTSRRVVQVGLQVTDRPRKAWEDQYPVKQFWADEVIGHEAEVVDQVVAHFKSIGVEHLYITNDIDGTDVQYAPATGTPEECGLHPNFVRTLIERAHAEFKVFGGDVVEVAPPLAGVKNFADETTCLLGADYLDRLIRPLCESV